MTQVTHSSGNVFEDMGFSEPTIEALKSDLVIIIRSLLEDPERDRAKDLSLMGISEEDAELLIRGRTGKYDIAELVAFISFMCRKKKS